MFKRLLSILTVLVMSFAFIGGAGLNAAEAVGDESRSTTRTITVHKVLYEEGGKDSHNPTKNNDGTYTNNTTVYDGTELNPTDFSNYFGSSAKTVGGVHFDIYEEGNSATPVKSGTTDENGKLVFAELDPTKEYTIKEDPTKSRITHVGGAAASEEQKKAVISQKSEDMTIKRVPQTLIDSTTNSEIREKAMNLHVYPKNEIKTPKAKISVKTLSGLSETVAYGQEHPWFLQADLPKGTNPYTKVELQSDVDASLFDVNTGTVKVYLANVSDADGTRTASNPVVFEAGDYNVTNEGNKLTVALTATGLAKVNAEENNGKTLIAEVPMKLKDGAAVYTAHSNNLNLVYNTASGDTPADLTVAAQDEPNVYTGEKKFIKKDGEEDTALANAEFKIFGYVKEETIIGTEGNITTFKRIVNTAEEGAEQKWAKLSESGSFIEWVGSEEEASIIKSGQDGRFTVKGLPYGDGTGVSAGETKYYIKETKEPENYVGLSEPAEFTVKNDSENPDEQKIYNFQVTVPKTGGAGTMALTVGGIILMTGAFLVYRRMSKKEAN